MKKKLPDKYQIWIDTGKKFHLSHAQVQMARELGLNPKKFGKLANHKQEPWKLPLGQFIERIYLKHFTNSRPDHVRSIEELVKEQKKKREAAKERRQLEKAEKHGNGPQPTTLHVKIREREST